MNNYSFETINSKFEELEKYLNEELIDYDVAEAGGNKPKYIYIAASKIIRKNL